MLPITYGETVQTAQVDSVQVTVYDSSHVSQFVLNGVSSTNGVFVVAKNTPNLNAGEGYYVVAEIASGTKVFTSTETVLALD